MDEIKEDEKLRPAPSFRVESELVRLGPSSFNAFSDIAGQWELSDEEALELLALGSGTPVEQLKVNPVPKLFTEDCMLRISYPIGIYNGLHICHGDDLATNGSSF
jgi:hypothetical protein